MTEQIDAVVLVAHPFSRIHAAGITHIVLGTWYRDEVSHDHFGFGSA
jgi:hypothetical protein